MICPVVMGSNGIMYLPRLMRAGTDIQAILRSNLSNLNVCIVGITEEMDI
jgi:hypothetical protein